jgi:hypothetical protein
MATRLPRSKLIDHLDQNASRRVIGGWFFFGLRMEVLGCACPATLGRARTSDARVTLPSHASLQPSSRRRISTPPIDLQLPCVHASTMPCVTQPVCSHASGRQLMHGIFLRNSLQLSCCAACRALRHSPPLRACGSWQTFSLPWAAEDQRHRGVPSKARWRPPASQTSRRTCPCGCSSQPRAHTRPPAMRRTCLESSCDPRLCLFVS